MQPFSSSLELYLHPSTQSKLSESVLVSEFSVDENRKLTLGQSEARYLYSPLVGRAIRLDLNANFDTYIPNPRSEKMLQTFNWILAVADGSKDLKKIVRDADFVSGRGTTCRIASSDVIFICELENELGRVSDRNARDQLTSYWGHKFEQCVTGELPKAEPDTSKPVNDNCEFRAMFLSEVRSTNSTIRILYKGEIDCFDAELKTQLNSIGHGYFFYKKAFKWWLQSRLAGIKHLVVGIRDINGIVNSLEKISLEQLLTMTKDLQPAPCFSFLHSFLDYIKLKMSGQHSKEDKSRRNSMLGAQALRTKQKVEQKEKERRLKDRQKNLELQRQHIQKVANEDAQAAILEYGGVGLSSSASLSDHFGAVSNPAASAVSSSLSHHHLQAAAPEIAQTGQRRNSSKLSSSNRKIHQRYSLNANSYDRIQLPVRSPSTDYGTSNGSANLGHPSSAGSRFLRWLGLSGNGHSAKKQHQQQQAEKRRMSTY
uniref:Decapping nuclease n=1 Tax=Ditylenchus dipsaci TaxID=166011 RepID=A0A915DPZ8_9BILA